MGMEVPDWVGRFFLVVTGESWPQADEDGLWALAGVWSEFESALAAVEVEVADIASAVRGAGWEGEAAQAARARLVELVDGGSLRQLVDAAGRFSRFAYDAGTNVQYVKASIIGQLAILTVQILLLLPWVAFPPTSAAASSWISALVTFGRFMAQTFFRRLVMSVMFGVVLQLGLDVAIQFTQLFITRTRREWDGRRSGGAALAGALGGALGPVLFAGFGAVFGQRFVRSIVGFAGVGALTEFSAEQLADLILTGRREQTDDPWAPASAGAIEGVVDWLGSRRRGGAMAGLEGPGGVRVDVPDLGFGGGGIPGLNGVPFDPDPGPDRFHGDGVLEGDFTVSGVFPDGKTFIGSFEVEGSLTPRGGGGPVRGVFRGSGGLQGGFEGSFSQTRL
ncbi:hypothetical protein ACIBTV_31425, partial [Micromonospora sp. NPDC049366]|uniref:WXG100-like domain-containing protein n=1 Tax=Micromonospora sp. NPDC049366 TaxID=3364271 RepID=UPI0037AEF146